jgi:hypothetical protein
MLGSSRVTVQLAASQKGSAPWSQLFSFFIFFLLSILSSLSSPYIAPDFPFYRQHALTI